MPYRLFFALWPDKQATQQIQQLFAHYYWQSPAKPVPSVDWHITLNFIGDINEHQYQQLLPLIAQLHTKAFTLTLDQLVYWTRAEILLLEPRLIPPELTNLQDQLTQLLKRQQIKVEKRTYQPHLTLAHHCPDPDPHARIKLGPLHTPITFNPTQFFLADSYQRIVHRAEHYHLLKKWPLLS